MRYLSLDPGGTTGVCIHDTTKHKYDPKLRLFERKQLTGIHHVKLWELLGETLPDVIVCESFVYQRRDNVVLVSVEYIGIVRLFSMVYGIKYKEQPPASAKGLWGDDKLKVIGLHSPGQPHANDATRHLLYYITIDEGDPRFLIEWKKKKDEDDPAQ